MEGTESIFQALRDLYYFVETGHALSLQFNEQPLQWQSWISRIVLNIILTGRRNRIGISL